MESWPFTSYQSTLGHVLPDPDNVMLFQHDVIQPLKSNGFGIAWPGVVHDLEHIWLSEYVRYTPPWTSEDTRPTLCVGQNDYASESVSPLTSSPALAHTSTPTPQPAQAPRPILRWFEPGEPLPVGVGESTPPLPATEVILRRQTNRRPRNRGKFCIVCKENGDKPDTYRSHNVKDNKGIVLCPALRTYNCPECQNGGGDRAHKVEHCPLRRARMLDQIVHEGVVRRLTLAHSAIAAS